jgi:hypothetical protein
LNWGKRVKSLSPSPSSEGRGRFKI